MNTVIFHHHVTYLELSDISYYSVPKTHLLITERMYLTMSVDCHNESVVVFYRMLIETKN